MLLVLVLLFWLSFGVEFKKFCENLVSQATNTIFILYICICTNVWAAAIKIKWKRKTEPFYAHIQTRSRNTQSIVMCADVCVRCSFSIYVAAITITAQTIFPDRSFYLSFIFFFFFNLFLFCVIFFYTSSSSSWILNNYKWTSSTLRGTSFSKYSNYIFKRKQYMHCHRICCLLLSIYI